MFAILGNTVRGEEIINNMMIPIVEYYFYRDLFIATKNNVIMYISLNIEGLKVEKQKAKNEMLQDFLLRFNIDLIGLQEININWNKVDYKDRWQE